MSAAVTVPPGVELCHLPSPFTLRRGGSLEGAVLAYERQGSKDAPVVIVLGGISAHRHASAHAVQPQRGWWQGVVGAGLAIDTERFQVLSFDWLGGAGNSTGPAQGESFPFVDADDQAVALWSLCDALRIDKVHAIVGSSYGGMVAQHSAAMAPERCQRLVAIAAAHRSHAQASAWRHVQRSIVELGGVSGTVQKSLALARSLAMTTYRSPDELDERFGGGFEDPALASWLDARGASFASEWHAEQFLCLNRSIDAHQIDPRSIRVPTWLLAFDSDQLVPTKDIRDLALALPNLVGHREYHSRYGHDAFLKEVAIVSGFVAEALR